MKCKSSLVAAVLMGLFLFVGCNKDEGPLIRMGVPVDSTLVRYKSDIQPIFNAHCIECHTESDPKMNLLPCCSYEQLTTTGFNAPYVDTLVPTNSRLYMHLTGQLLFMPYSGPILVEEAATILLWIEQGAKNN